MPVEFELSAAVCNAFNVALLLTGDMNSAEHVALEAIEALDPEDLSAESLLCKVIDISIPHLRDSVEQTSRNWPTLPIELRNVLGMNGSIRSCFVLRVLLGLPLELCARLLHLEQHEFAARTLTAVHWLARLRMTNHGLVRTATQWNGCRSCGTGYRAIEWAEQ